jgi:hypothetical protein
MKQYDVLAMFSGGLDSILAAKTIQTQGFTVLCLHFVSPFFGHPGMLGEWSGTYGLDIEPVDVSRGFVAMMLEGPAHGVGKGLNPCVDCKILMLKHCRELMAGYGAKFLVTGEVKGQRPMSQRRDALDVISRDAGVRDVLLRPLCARTMKPTPMEESGLVDRDRLHAFGGRNRQPQFRLARTLGIVTYPQPAGGCKLTELDSAKRYVPVFRHARPARPEDFRLANVGRQFWSGARWLAMGRDQAGNEALAALAEPGDRLLDVAGFPSPLGVIRDLPGADWDEAALVDAAALLASYSPKAAASGGPVVVNLTRGGQTRELVVTPSRQSSLGLKDVSWEEQIPVKKAMFRENPEDDGY